MFLRTDLIIPQKEHARFASEIASHLNLKYFDELIITKQSLITALTSHHQGYGENDRIEFLKLNDTQIEEIFRDDFYGTFDDSIAKLINKFHHFRLIGNRINKTGAINLISLKEEMEEKIILDLEELDISKNEFSYIDRFMDICDRISFIFCSGVDLKESKNIFSDLELNDVIEITYSLGGNMVRLKPWIFEDKILEGEIVGYNLESKQIISYKIVSD